MRYRRSTQLRSRNPLFAAARSSGAELAKYHTEPKLSRRGRVRSRDRKARVRNVKETLNEDANKDVTRRCRRPCADGRDRPCLGRGAEARQATSDFRATDEERRSPERAADGREPHGSAAGRELHGSECPTERAQDGHGAAGPTRKIDRPTAREGHGALRTINLAEGRQPDHDGTAGRADQPRQEGQL